MHMMMMMMMMMHIGVLIPKKYWCSYTQEISGAADGALIPKK
jgi:hypothetical protein